MKKGCYNLLRIGVLSLLLAGAGEVAAQKEIFLKNPSFEDIPRAGGIGYSGPIRGWHDCATAAFPGESAPDIHPHPEAWKVNKSAVDGNTFLGLVVRQNDSWEFLSQALSSPIEAGQCYQFSIYLAKSETYMGLRDYSGPTDGPARFTRPFLTPAVLRVWGGSSLCDKDELLIESGPVDNLKWDIYGFKVEPKQSHRFVIFEAFYKTPTLVPYNGHVLVDKASSFVPIDCAEEIVIEEVELPESVNRAPEVMIPPPPPEPDPEPASIVEEDSEEEAEPPATTPREAEVEGPKILSDLQRDKLRKGQTIRINNLYFKADSSRIEEESFPVLEEMFHFLVSNPDVIIEIGGHTNTKPEHWYCDKLSAARAKAVTDYLIEQGVSDNQLVYKGYGKRKPLIPGDKYSTAAQRKNQRVEIKILSLEGE